ncbi:MAG: LptF/LptG family permease [Bacteroidales bacterium]|jgi:lipopolysaccharide export system permease protein|nr:LptF/LptG family permease [Bacteroidales bacterium]
MLGIKKLDWLVVRSYLTPFIITFFVTTFILLMQFLWKYIDDLVGKGLEWSVVAELMFYASMGLFEMSLPLAILCASIFVYGNLGENNELIAIKSAGISLVRIMKPLVIVNLLIASLAFVYSNNVLPYSNLRLWSLMFDVRHQRPALNIQEGVFFDGLDNIRIKIESKNINTNMMYNVLIYDHRKEDGNTNVILADSAMMQVTPNEQYLIFSLFNGRRYEELLDARNPRQTRIKRPFQEQKFTKQEVLFELDPTEFDRTNMELFRHNAKMQNLMQLQYTIDSLKAYKKKLNDRSFKHFFMYKIFKGISVKEEPPLVVPVDSLFYAMNEIYKKQSVSRALDFARMAESYLTTNIDNEHEQNLVFNRHRIELHKKFTLAIACFIMFFVGAPFGAIVRKGGLGIPVIFSFIFFLVYYIISMIGEKGVKSGEMNAVWGMWFATLIVFVIGMIFTYMATHDKVIARPKILIQNLIGILKLKKQKNI